MPLDTRAASAVFDVDATLVGRASAGREPVTVGFVGTYPPTRCGIATFTASLREAMALPCSGVVALVESAGELPFGSEVVGELVRRSPASLKQAVAALDRFDVVVVQHEFGIYGGKDGCDVLDLVRDLRVPVIVVAHTVLNPPSPAQRRILEQLARDADLLVVQSQSARSRLFKQHEIPSGRVRVVPHGAPSNLSPLPVRDGSRRPVVLSWGLLGRGKGVELGIEALGQLRDLDPPPRYVIHGQTHPNTLAQEGEAYRESLLAQAHALGVLGLVEFDDGYGDKAALLGWIREADVVLLPYRSRDQAVSGVLVEAIASGRPVVATRFPHAVELLSEGSGFLVPHDDARALADVLRTLLTRPLVATRAAAVARRQAPQHYWENVGKTYVELARSVAGSGVFAGRSLHALGFELRPQGADPPRFSLAAPLAAVHSSLGDTSARRRLDLSRAGFELASHRTIADRQSSRPSAASLFFACCPAR